MHWLPNFCAPSETSAGISTAAVLTTTFSAPAWMISFMERTERIPPPKANGT
jgi:hypothetical protein